MKKTILLIVALIIGATSANAQRFISLDAPKHQKAVANKEADANLKIKKDVVNPSKDDFVYGPSVMTVSFSTNDVNYSFDHMPGHTAGDLQGKFRRMDTSAASTTELAANYNEWVHYYYNSYGNYIWFTNRLGTKMGDGYALLSPIDKFYADGESNSKIYNTAIRCTEPIVTTGFNTVDVIFNQIARRFNWDRYFIDYSTDANFNVYDSLEFNVKGIEVNVNNYGSWKKRITLPVSKSVDKPALYIRLRYTCPLETGLAPSGYMWLVDEINVYDGPAQRIDEISTNHFDAYGIVPQGMQLDTVYSRAIVENSGGDTLFGSVLEDRFATATDIQINPVLFDTDLNFVNVSATPTNITTDIRVDTVRDRNQVIVSLDVRRYVALIAATSPLYNEQAGLYGVSSGVKYLPNATSTDYSLKALNDSIYYRVSPMPEATNSTETAVWAADMDILAQNSAWANGMAGANLVTGYTASVHTPGYTVCNKFNTPENLTENTYYAKGVQVVAAADSSFAGAQIKATLKEIDTSATTWELLVRPVLDINNQPVESDVRVVTTGDVNNGLFTEYSLTTNFNKINMPFTASGILLKPSTDYYACYTLIDNNGGNSKFMVAMDDNRYYGSFKEEGEWSKIVTTPGMESFETASWGSFFGWYCDNNAPMIRLLVSKNPAALASINSVENTSSFNFTAYPNPAQNETTIEYTLNNKGGNVVITVTDIMGREVVRMDQGKKAANSSSRITLNTQNLNNGTYFYTLSVNGEKETKKLVIKK